MIDSKIILDFVKKNVKCEDDLQAFFVCALTIYKNNIIENITKEDFKDLVNTAINRLYLLQDNIKED